MSDDIAKRLPHRVYTEQELKELKRLDIRFIATERYGMDTKQCSKTNTTDVLVFILEAQEKEFGKGGKAAPKGKAAPAGKAAPKGKVKEPEPEEDPEEDPAEEAAEGLSGDLETKLDAVGVGMDSGFEALGSALLHTQKQLFILMGLVEDIHMASVGGEDPLNERKIELEELWEKEGNG